MTTTTRTIRKPDDTYLKLIRQYPLRALRTEDDAAEAGEVLARVMMSRGDGTGDPGLRQYLDALSDLILRYQEGPGRRAKLPATTPLGILKFLMKESSLNTEGLGRVIGSQSAASMILNGKRSMSKTHIVKIARHFKVSPALFLDEPAA